MIDLGQLKRECAAIGVRITGEQAEKLDLYAEMLMEWNEKINLTAIKKPKEIVTKHFVDSLTLLAALDLPQGGKLIDVGTGAGFPAVPLKVIREDLDVTLLDSQNKRIGFLNTLGTALGQRNLCIHARAEEAGRKAEYREKYYAASARAVAHLRELAEYCLPFVTVGGVFAAMKGGEIEEEAEESEKAIRLLGGKIDEIRRFTLPDGSARTIVIVKKTSHISAKYPRPHAKIAKTPLM